MSNTDTEPMILIDHLLDGLEQLRQQPITELLVNLDYLEIKIKEIKRSISFNIGNLPPLKPTKPGIYCTRFYKMVAIYHLTQLTNKIIGKYADSMGEIFSPNSFNYWTRDGVAVNIDNEEGHSDIVLFIGDLPSFR